MQGGRLIALLAAGACLASCGEATIDCGAEPVIGTLATMVRDRVLRVAADAYPPGLDPAKKLALTKATRVTPRDSQLLDWDKTVGRLACVTQVVIDAPGPEIDTNLRSVAVLRYRVSRDADRQFFVEVAYGDLLDIFPKRQDAASDKTPAR